MSGREDLSRATRACSRAVGWRGGVGFSLGCRKAIWGTPKQVLELIDRLRIGRRGDDDVME